METTNLINVEIDTEFIYEDASYIRGNVCGIEIHVYNLTDNRSEKLPKYLEVQIR